MNQTCRCVDRLNSEKNHEHRVSRCQTAANCLLLTTPPSVLFNFLQSSRFSSKNLTARQLASTVAKSWHQAGRKPRHVFWLMEWLAASGPAPSQTSQTEGAICWHCSARTFFGAALAQAADTCRQQTVVSWHMLSHCVLRGTKGSLQSLNQQ
jgi:hypothetical protein